MGEALRRSGWTTPDPERRNEGNPLKLAWAPRRAQAATFSKRVPERGSLSPSDGERVGVRGRKLSLALA